MELELEGASNFYIERFEHVLQGFEVAGKLGKKNWTMESFVVEF